MTWLKRLKSKNSGCPMCGSPLKHCGCGVIGPKKIGDAPYPKSPAKKADPRRTIGRGKNFNKVAEDKSARGGAAGGGMTEKGVREYRRNNPGSKLQTAVTEKNPSEKDKARRRSFCARSRNWKGPRGRAARRRWRC